ncbi:preprotein translocase subunit SecY [Lujinxingia litoralis]|uniref:Protein translocase subunit SecY n=1 Tax=Lujinxingia litoralis TaxID=2211119 RepID=A0A328C8T5_9DELT|nr:preprotein translocase subunit SecY [Lujinxingia litoralis]RAL25027.1 preprotein translocase subunit SecY [Lujinxingia litoralis]
MAGKFRDIPKIPELRRRLLFTLGLLAIYRIGVFVTVPGVDRGSMSEMMSGDGGGLLGLVNLFTGGALEMMSIFALGIMPYISSSIIFQLMQVVVPAIERLKKEGESGRKKITQYTRYGTVILGIIQGFGISLYLENMHNSNPELGLLVSPGWGFRLLTVLTLTAGTVFVMWLGEQITERGIGNGISLIITGAIIAQFPTALFQTYTQYTTGAMDTITVGVLLVVAIGVTGFIVLMETAQRRIPLQYAKRMVGRKIYGGQSHHLPLKVNMAGVIPPIFAMSLLIFPTTIASYFQDHPAGQFIQTVFTPGDWRYNVIYCALIIFFCYFYTAVQVNPMDIADNLKKSNAFVPGIRPGKKTAEYIDQLLTRLTTAGSIYVAAVCVLPYFLIDELGVNFYFGGTSLLILVVVGLDTVGQIENHLITRHYEGFGARPGSAEGSSRIKGRTLDEPENI